MKIFVEENFEPENGDFGKSCHVRIFTGILEILICAPCGIRGGLGKALWKGSSSFCENFSGREGFLSRNILNLKMMILRNHAT